MAINQLVRVSFGRGFSALLACLMLSQILMTGFAQASSAGNGEASFGVMCQTSANPAEEVNKSQSPQSHTHRHGICCILHHAAINPKAWSIRESKLFEFPAKLSTITGSLTSIPLDLAIAEEPNAPRAPPHLWV